MKSLKEFIFGRWECTETCPMQGENRHGEKEIGLLMLFKNSRSGKLYSRMEFLNGYKQEINPELAKGVIQQYQSRYGK